jgi:uncharacterized Zn-finger protein
MSEANLKTACSQHIYEVTTAALPLSCPMPSMRLWDAHPKVYLPIEKTGHAQCYYCGAEYILTDFTAELTEDDKTDVEYANVGR